jgi:hypothetical protein
LPFVINRPLDGVIIPLIAFNNVDFPAPFGPTNAARQPKGTSKLTSDKIIGAPGAGESVRPSAKIAASVHAQVVISLLSIGG